MYHLEDMLNDGGVTADGDAQLYYALHQLHDRTDNGDICTHGSSHSFDLRGEFEKANRICQRGMTQMGWSAFT